EVTEEVQFNPTAWTNFITFPALYRRVRIDNIQRNRNCRHIFISRLNKLIEASERGEMIGDWHDCGRLLMVADF
ncbi:MAG: YdeI/OmpD-associated family protein, partial [Duncaniella sp.]|nr:YdeI/OmpD-associated family protein [Duncaniella sp.]